MLALCLMLALPGDPGNDNNVFFDGLFHDSAQHEYRSEGACFDAGPGTCLKLRSYQFDLTEARLHLWSGASWQSTSMQFERDVPECRDGGLPFPCVLWAATVPASSPATAYRFLAVDGTDQNFVGRAVSGTGSQVFADGVEPSVIQSFDLGRDAGGGTADAGARDAGAAADAGDPRDAAVPDAASPDAGGATDAAAAPDAATRTDSGAAADAAIASDAGLGDAAGEHADASIPGDDGGACIPGCRNSQERVVCVAGGIPNVIRCTAGTQCLEGACVGGDDGAGGGGGGCACRERQGSGISTEIMVLALGLAGLRRRRSNVASSTPPTS